MSKFTTEQLEEMEMFLGVLPNQLNSVETEAAALLSKLLREYRKENQVYVLVHEHQKGISTGVFSSMEKLYADGYAWTENNRAQYEVPADLSADDVFDRWQELTDYEERFHVICATVD